MKANPSHRNAPVGVSVAAPAVAAAVAS
jgi:hypothetical protein